MIKKLKKKDTKALIKIADEHNIKLSKKQAKKFCKCVHNKDCHKSISQVYGIYDGNTLIAVMTATFCYMFPTEHSKNGKMCHVSGAFTLPKYRHQGYASKILKAIEKDARKFGADYICCDSLADDFYIKAGWMFLEEEQSRMYKRL